MLDWWNSLTSLQIFFAYIAIPATLILIIQSVMLLLGFGGDSGDCDADFDPPDPHDLSDGSGSGLALFTIRGLVAFFTVGGWVGIAAIDWGFPTVLAILTAFVAGSAALVGIAWLFRAILQLQGSGNLQVKNAIGHTGRVYIRIPANQSGSGKVNVTVQERLSELDAVTASPCDILTGELVRIVDVIDNGILLVEPASESKEKI